MNLLLPIRFATCVDFPDDFRGSIHPILLYLLIILLLQDLKLVVVRLLKLFSMTHLAYVDINNLFLRERHALPGRRSLLRRGLCVCNGLKLILVVLGHLREEKQIGIRWASRRLLSLGHPLRC